MEKNVEKKERSGFATAALVLGIIGIVLSFIPIINNAALILGVLSVIFGIIGIIKSAKKTVAIVSVVLAVTAIVITLVMMNAAVKAVNDAVDDLNSTFTDINSTFADMTGDNTSKILKEDADVSIGKFTVIKGDFFDETELKVTVKNKTSDKKSFSIHITADDSSGNRIGDDYIYANDLSAGQSQEFKCFTFVDEEKTELMKNATFSVVEISMN